MPLSDPASADLPAGQWSHLLVGHQWPGAAALAVLAGAAANRSALGSAHDGYAETLRALHAEIAERQNGISADAATAAFRRGEVHARGVCAKNTVKKGCYESARHWVANLRDELDTIAASGNSAIRQILDSEAPAELKFTALVDTVVQAREQANIKAAQCGANLLGAIQQVLDSRDAGTSAREFARSHGVHLDAAFGSPSRDLVRADVGALMDGTGTAPAASRDRDVGEDMNGCPPATGTVVGALVPGNPAPHSAAAAALSGAVAPAQPGPGSTRVPGGAGLTPGVAHLQAAHPRSAGTPGRLPAYGSERSAPRAPTAPPRPGQVLRAAPASAPVSAAAFGTSTVASASRSTPRPAAVSPKAATTAAAAAGIEPAGEWLRRLLEAVARQAPGLCWAVGIGTDGRILLATDLAGGWIPPHIAIPAPLELIAPPARRGDAVALLGPIVTTERYLPGHPLPPGEPGALSPTARATAPVPDLGWHLCRATRCHDGLPRLAHTLAVAVNAGTGWLDSEADLLNEHLRAVATEVLDSYPDTVDPAAVGSWQLLATISALLAGEPPLADYHFAWFR
ncbi:MAG: DUF5631 domain-containing protein [Mycobacterium sp.]